jgi:sulfofructose kinase
MTAASPTVVACVGHATLDLIHRIEAFPERPLKLRATSFGTSVGGMAAGGACAVARLGGQSQFWGPVGDDTFGDMVRAELAKAGVDASWVAPAVGAASSHSAVIVDAAGERLIVNHRGTALRCGPEILPLQRLRAHAVLVDVRWAAGAAVVLKHANAIGIPTVLDGDMGDSDGLRELVPMASA